MHTVDYFLRMYFEKQNFWIQGIITFKFWFYIAYLSQKIENN